MTTDYERDPQLNDPLKRDLVLGIYRAIKYHFPEVTVRFSKHYEEEIKVKA